MQRYKSDMLTVSELKRITRNERTEGPMPDFTFEDHVQCAGMSAVFHEGGYEQAGVFQERRWPTCTCKAYRFGKRTIHFGGQMVPRACKHIVAVQLTACQYHSMTDGQPEVEGVCPNCGGPLEHVRVAV